MKKIIASLAMIALVVWNVPAALIAYDPFNYSSITASTASPSGAPTQTTGGGFTGNWSAANSTTIGLTYSSLPTANSAMSASSGAYETLASPISSGTYYFSFLFKNAGNNGGNVSGLELVDSSGKGILFGNITPASGTQGGFGVKAVTAYTTLGTTLWTGSSSGDTYANANLIVIKLVGAGSSWSGTVWVNPTAGVNTPPAATGTFTTSSQFTVALLRSLYQGGGNVPVLDEYRVADSYGEAVGVAPVLPNVPADLAATPGNNSVSLSWTGSTNSPATYNVKRSTASGAEVTVATVTAPTVAFTDSVLGGVTYYYVVSAVNGAGESADSSEVSATPVFAAPAAPTALNGTPTNNSVGLTWTAAAFADTYNVKRSITSGSGYSVIGTTTAPMVAYTDATAIDGMVYYYVVSAVNGAGEGADSTQKIITMPPAMPTGLAATPGDNSVSLNWTAASSGATGYQVKRSIVSGSGYVTVGTTVDPTTAFTDSIVGGQTYYYVVTATNASGESLISSEVSATPALVAPATPASLAATPGNNTVSLNWPAAAFATSYNVKRSTTSGAEATITNIATAGFSDTNAVNGMIYYYTVSALNAAGESADTSEASVTMRPTTPTGLAATPGANQVSLSWMGSSLATGYKVKRSTVSGSGYVTIGTTADPAVAFTDPIIGGVTYYYVVTATNLSGETVSSAEASATPTLAAPAAPTNLAGTAGDNSVALIWTAASFSTSYNVKRSTTSGSGYTTISTTGAVTGTNYSDTTAVNGTAYYYVVSGTNAAGESANSSEVSVTPNFVAVYEPFNYTTSIPNGTASTGLGENGNWTCGTTPSIVSGLTYTALPTANSALSTGGGRQYVNLATPTGSGTKWVSYLFKCSSDLGGNWAGVYLKGDQATSLWAGFRGGFNGVQNVFGLGTVTSAGTAATGGTAQGTSVNIANTTVHLIVMKIDFNTSGVNDTVTLYVDPTANTAAPSVAATTTLTTVNIGTISAMGVNIQGGTTLTVDEFRIGQTFGEVVGYNPPAAPTGLVATPGLNTVSLTWNSVGTATGYQVLRGTSTGVYTVTNSAASNAYNDNAAIGGTTYFYVVQATNASGASASSMEVSATPTIAVPDQPTGLVATGTNGAVSLRWDAALGAGGYNVKRSTSSGTEVTIANVAANSYYDTDVANGTTYFYKVSSTNSAGESADSSEASATPDLPPSAPTDLVATAGNSQVALSWTASPGAASYNVKRSTTSGTEVTIANVGSTSYLDTSAVKFTPYFYTVSAVSSYGESADSSEVSATPTGVYGPSAYEPFDYTSLTNGTASTAAGFSGNWNVSGNPNIVAGLTYPDLTTTNNSYSHGAAGAQTTVDFASPMASGTKYISFLFQGSGNPGGNACGIFLKGDNASSLFVGFEGGYSPTQTSFGLGTVSSTILGGATALGSTTPIDNTTVHLVVVAIDFNTSSTSDTVSLWIDPPAGVLTPGVPANVVNSSFDVGTLSAFGINITGAFPIGIDEVRVGDVYGDVVGYGQAAFGSPVITTSVAGNQLTLAWPVENLGWFLQSQTNSLNTGLTANWVDVTGSETDTSAVITMDPASPTVFFRLRSP